MNTSTARSNRWRNARLCLIATAFVITLIGLFYTEENWRGKSAWEKCKRNMEAQGIDLKWADGTPDHVPDSENIFGVPKMQEWFVGRGPTELSRKIAYPGTIRLDASGPHPNHTPTRLEVARIRIQLPGDRSVSGSNVINWNDPQASEQVARAVKSALGPVALHPGSSNLLFMPHSPNEIQPAQLILKCQTAPSMSELRRFLPNTSIITDTSVTDPLQLDPVDGGYTATMPSPETTAAFLKWNQQFEVEFSLISKALERRSIRMHGSYAEPIQLPIPNFMSARAYVQSLAAMAQCHLLQGNPDGALDDLTRIHEISRIFTNRPITLVGSMIDESVRGLYADTIADGFLWKAWREPQLAALEEQLGTIDIIPIVHESLRWEAVSACESLQSIPVAQLLQLFAGPAPTVWWDQFAERWEARLAPGGWTYLNMVTAADRARKVDTWMDPNRHAVFPKNVDADQTALFALSHRSPSSFIVFRFIPNVRNACRWTALVQTKVNHAIIVCGLERYHLAHGEYPENLGALVPQFIATIPADVIGGQPPHYRPATDGTYVLYSIGWTGRDGGGARGKSNADGDWVWPEPKGH